MMYTRKFFAVRFCEEEEEEDGDDEQKTEGGTQGGVPKGTVGAELMLPYLTVNNLRFEATLETNKSTTADGYDVATAHEPLESCDLELLRGLADHEKEDREQSAQRKEEKAAAKATKSNDEFAELLADRDVKMMLK